MKDRNNQEIINLPVSSLKPDPNQPRKFIDKEQVERLKDSIKEEGIIEAIKFFENDNGKFIISGQLRWEAAKLAGIEEIPGIKVKEEDAPIIALLENMSQTPMLPMEEAQALHRVLKQTDKSQNELAKSLGIPKSSISEKLSLINLPTYIQDFVLCDPRWTAQNLRMLVKIKDPAKQREVFEKLKARLGKKGSSEGKEIASASAGEKWKKDFKMLNTSSERFKIDFEKRIKKIVPEDEVGKYSERLEPVFTFSHKCLKQGNAERKKILSY